MRDRGVCAALIVKTTVSFGCFDLFFFNVIDLDTETFIVSCIETFALWIELKLNRLCLWNNVKFAEED